MRQTIANRLYVIDRLRGLALLGVAVVNAPLLLMSSTGMEPAQVVGLTDRLAAVVTWVVFQAKAYVIFSFLFGYSFTIFLAAARRKGLATTRAYLQRLGSLALFGTAHALLFFPGDILVVYAVFGLPLLWLSRAPDRVLKAGVAVGYAGQVLLFALLAGAGSSNQDSAPIAALDNGLRTGGVTETTALHVAMWPTYQATLLAIQGALVAAMFCLGLLCGRHQVLRDIAAHAGTWRRLRAIGLTAGLALQGLSAALAFAPGAGDAAQFGGLALQYLTAPVLSAGMVATIALLPATHPIRWVEPAGQLSLSSYLGGSAIMATLALGWGAGLLGLTAAPTLAIGAVAWVGLLIAAHAWQRARLGPGPAERGLRALTYLGTAPAGRTGSAA